MNPVKAVRLALSGLAAMSAMVAGCASTGNQGGSSTIQIVSDPPGATAYASGRKIGVTPLRFVPGEYFNARPVFNDSDAIVAVRYVGTLTLERTGCEPYDLSVNDRILASDIHAQLNCSSTQSVNETAVQAASEDPAKSASRNTPAATPAAETSAKPGTGSRFDPGDSAEKRLIRLETLHDRGLITDEEYQSLRKKILDTL